MLSLKELSCRVCRLEKNATTTGELEEVPSVGTLQVASPVIDGETVTIGSAIFEVVTVGGEPSTGNIPVDLTGSPSAVKASSTLTGAGNAVATNTITLGTTVYTFQTTPAAAYDVQLGVDTEESLLNLYAAINGTGTPGVEYFAGTLPNPAASGTTLTPTTIIATAIVAGTAGNTIDTASTVAGFTWAGTDLSGGGDPSASEFTTAFELAVNSASLGGVNAFRATTTLVVVSDEEGRLLGTTETLSGVNNAWAAATLVAGSNDSLTGAVIASRAANSTEDAQELMVFPFGFPPSAAIVAVRTSAGVTKAWDGAVTFSGNNVILTSSGAVDIDATDVVTVSAA